MTTVKANFPEVVRYENFLGLDKVNNPLRFASEKGTKLLQAENVNITRDFALERRDGYSRYGSMVGCSSLWGNGEVCYVVRGGDLVTLDGTVLREGVGVSSMSFADAKNGFVYYTNGSVSGKISGSIHYSLGTSSDEYKETLPIGDFVSFLSPRVLMVKDNVVYFSDVVNRDVYHSITGFVQFESTVKMVAPIGQSLFVSDEGNTWFLRKVPGQIPVNQPMFKLEKVANYPAGNSVSLVYGAKDNKIVEGVMWGSSRGVCLGTEDGSFMNLTENNYNLPAGVKITCCLFRQYLDMNLFIAVFGGNE